MTNMIRVEKGDTLTFAGDKICAVVNSKEYTYELSAVNKMMIITTDAGPFGDDMGLAIDVGNGEVICIMSEHECYDRFLFDQIGKVLPVDFQKIIEAASCAENNSFEIYVRDN